MDSPKACKRVRITLPAYPCRQAARGGQHSMPIEARAFCTTWISWREEVVLESEKRGSSRQFSLGKQLDVGARSHQLWALP
eukprot:scaffold54046_cov30-Tisochrysis_lutea.AAC.2